LQRLNELGAGPLGLSLRSATAHVSYDYQSNGLYTLPWFLQIQRRYTSTRAICESRVLRLVRLIPSLVPSQRTMFNRLLRTLVVHYPTWDTVTAQSATAPPEAQLRLAAPPNRTTRCRTRAGCG